MAKYDAAFWRRTLARARRNSLLGTLLRMVENQEQKVTVALVDNLDEHGVLEQLLEASKPALGLELERFDYLLRSPWRYPPLPWGSRFGRRSKPGIFYGSLSVAALLAEAAYYRFVFVGGMDTPFRDRVISQHTRFEAHYRTTNGILLTKPPFARHTAILRDPSHYAPCQALGAVLHDAGIAAIVYLSARSAAPAENIALLHPASLRSRRHRKPVRGLCETWFDRVQFRFGDELTTFPREQFLVGGELPAPPTG
ncbi:RES family NAD+ phosphorylase [soil metagenome]